MVGLFLPLDMDSQLPLCSVGVVPGGGIMPVKCARLLILHQGKLWKPHRLRYLKMEWTEF